MKKKSNLKQYLQDPEAKTFLEKHADEFPDYSYDDYYEGMNVNQEDISLILQNTSLLRKQNERDVINDYFNKMSIEDIRARYYPSNSLEYVSLNIFQIKQRILKLVYKHRDNSVVRFPSAIPINKIQGLSLKKVSLTFNGKSKYCYLVKVHWTRRLKFESPLSLSDYESLINKAKLVFQFLDKETQIYCYTVLKHLVDGDLLEMKQNTIDELSSYRWIDGKGNILSDDIDALLTDKNCSTDFDFLNTQLF